MFDDFNSIRYSIVIPLFNERDNIAPLHQALTQVMADLSGAYELVFVDDGSTDGSGSVLKELAREDDHVTVVSLRKNSGKSAALCAGFDSALGTFLITIDGDLQHDPADIPRFIAKLEDGFDIVCGRRETRAGTNWLVRAANRSANWMLAKLSGVPIHDFGGGFKAYRRELVAQLPLYGELQRLIPLMALRQGGKICELPITISPRERGASKYGLVQKLPFLLDLLTVRFLLDYLSRPLHFFGTAGFLAVFAGSSVGLWLLAQKIIYGAAVMNEHGPLMFFAAVLFLTGVQLVALGLLAELQVRHYHERADWQTRYTVIRGHADRSKDERSIRDKVSG